MRGEVKVILRSFRKNGLMEYEGLQETEVMSKGPESEREKIGRLL